MKAVIAQLMPFCLAVVVHANITNEEVLAQAEAADATRLY
jgi:hypothetical protein